MPLPPGTKPLVEVATDSEFHLVLAYGTSRLRLCIRHAPCRSVPAFLITYDKVCALRLAAVAHLEQIMRGNRVAAVPAGGPTSCRHTRYTQLLGIHDALEAGASSRDLAFDLIFPNHSPLAGAMWKGSSERRHVLRLIANARRQVSGGYRGLLLHR